MNKLAVLVLGSLVVIGGLWYAREKGWLVRWNIFPRRKLSEREFFELMHEQLKQGGGERTTVTNPRTGESVPATMTRQQIEVTRNPFFGNSVRVLGA